MFRCRLQFHQFSSHVFHFVGESHRCRLSATSQPHMFVEETFDEFDQSSGRVVSVLLSHKRNGIHRRTNLRPQRPASWHISVLSLLCLTLSSQNPKSNAITGSCSPFSRKSQCKMWTRSFPRPMTHSSHRTREDLRRRWLSCQCLLLPPVVQIFLLLLLVLQSVRIHTVSGRARPFVP